MRLNLEAVLERDESPPPSMKEVASRFKYDARFLRKHFPDLCRAISARHTSYQKNCYNKRIEQLSNRVRQIALQLANEGLYPSNTRVSSQLEQPGAIRNQDVRAALREVRLQLGWKT